MTLLITGALLHDVGKGDGIHSAKPRWILPILAGGGTPSAYPTSWYAKNPPHIVGFPSQLLLHLRISFCPITVNTRKLP
jgi:hypothetical protein